MGCRWEVNQYLRSPHPIATEIIEYYEECLNGARDIVTLKELSDYMVDRGEDAIPDGVTFWGLSAWLSDYTSYSWRFVYHPDEYHPFKYFGYRNHWDAELDEEFEDLREGYHEYFEPLLWADIDEEEDD